MVERIGWIIFDILMLIYYFIHGGTLNIVFGCLFSLCAVLWIIDLIFWYKKEKRRQEDIDQLRMEIKKRL